MTYQTDEPRVSVPEGDGLVIEGRIVSLKDKRTDFGTVTKMTVKVETPEGAFLVWGTLPRALEGEYGCLGCLNTRAGQVVHRDDCSRDYAYGFIGAADVGDVVRFTANVTRGDRDPSFGFFHRPRKASIVSQGVKQ